MRVVIAGSRDLTNLRYVDLGVYVFERVHKWGKVVQVVSGGAPGIDSLGEDYSFEHDLCLKRFPVSKMEWDLLGPSAGHLRNGKMARYADALIAIWDGSSPGTRNMIGQMIELGKPVTVLHVLKRMNDDPQLPDAAVRKRGSRTKTSP
jgi:hypothetical protein